MTWEVLCKCSGNVLIGSMFLVDFNLRDPHQSLLSFMQTGNAVDVLILHGVVAILISVPTDRRR